MTALDDLVGVWRSENNNRFENYRATFTILKESPIAWAWLDDLVSGTAPADSLSCPLAWQEWVSKGVVTPLQAAVKKVPRSVADQRPCSPEESAVLAGFQALTDREFEFAARQLLPLLDMGFVDAQVTRPTQDGGRDVIASYRIGEPPHERLLSVYAEAKKWKGGVGVKPVARLLSRLKHRDLGFFVDLSATI
jgi:hypothetical protein